MHNLDLIIRGKTHSFSGPSNWNEVPALMAERLSRLRSLIPAKPHLSLMLPELLYNIPRELLSWVFDADYIRRKEPGISTEEIEECIGQGFVLRDLCSWVLSGDPPNQWLLKQLKVKGKIFYGPQEDLANSSFEEFMFAEQYYNEIIALEYMGNNDFIGDVLNHLVAVLYRIGSESHYKKTGDYRFPFTVHGIDMRLQSIAAIPNELKQFILFNYQGVRQELAKTYQHVFKVSETHTPVETWPSSTWLDVACGLAGENISNLSTIRAENLHIVLRFLDNRIKAMESLKTPE